MYYKTNKTASRRYFDTCFMHNIGEVFDIRWHDLLSMYYIDMESCHRLSGTPPILCINTCQNNEESRTFGSYSKSWLKKCSMKKKNKVNKNFNRFGRSYFLLAHDYVVFLFFHTESNVMFSIFLWPLLKKKSIGGNFNRFNRLLFSMTILEN